MSRRTLLHCLAPLGLTLVMSPLTLAITTAPSWETPELVSTSGNFGGHTGADRSLAYDHHGNPGIAFFDDADDDLHYARRVPGVGWADMEVDDTGTDNVGKYPSLAYDRYERPAVSYWDQTNADLKFAHFNGTTWDVETADTTGSVGWYTSLAFDLLGRPAIAYRNASNSSLKYVADTDGDLSLADEMPVTVVNDFVEGEYASLVFDPLNRPMIAHIDNTNDDLRFSVEEPGLGWITTTVDDSATTVNSASIAIDPDTGYPAIAYEAVSGEELKYAAWDGNAWDLEVVGTFGTTGGHASLAFDPADGNPAISFYDNTDNNNDLKLAWHDGSSWQTQLVDTTGNVGFASSLAFNDFGNGFPSIAYFRGSSDLYFIEDPPVTVPEPSSLVLLAIGLGAVSFRRKTSNCKVREGLTRSRSVVNPLRLSDFA